jgi:hypothetical protein
MGFQPRPVSGRDAYPAASQLEFKVVTINEREAVEIAELTET